MSCFMFKPFNLNINATFRKDFTRRGGNSGLWPLIRPARGGDGFAVANI